VEVLEDRTLPNASPVLSIPSGPFSVVKTTQFSLQVTATDKDKGETLTFSLIGAPASATITSTQTTPPSGSAATGNLTWTPTEDQGPTSYTFTIQVTDNGKPVKSAAQQITVTTLAAGIVGNDLLIVGTSTNQGTATNPGNDTVSVSATAANVVNVTVNGQAYGPFTIPTGGKVRANLFAGDDTFTLDESDVPVGPQVIVDGGTGNNTLIEDGTSGADTFTITGTSVSLSGAGELDFTNFQTLLVNGLGGDDTATMTGIGPATTFDGGPGTNTFTGSFAAGFSGALTVVNTQNVTMQVTGDFGGSMTVNNPGGLQQLSVTGSVTAGSSITATNVSSATIGTLAGTLLASGGSIVGANITSIAPGGLLEATEAVGAPGSGVISNATIGTNSGTISAGSISGMVVTTNSQVISAAGQGTTTNVSIGTNSGTFSTMEDANPGSGTMSNTTVGTNSGTVSAGSISGMSVTSNSGTVTSKGQGTTTNVSIGTNSGTFSAVEDTNPGSGTMSNTTVGTNSGTVSAGSISGMSVTSNSGTGTITAHGQGTTTNVSIGTNAGTFSTVEDTNPGSGTMSMTTVGTNSGTVSAGSISGMSVTSNSGTITSKGQGTTTNVSIGTNSGTFSAVEDTNPGSGTMSNTTVGTNSGTVSAGSISGMSVTSNSGTGTVTAKGQGTTTNVSIGTNAGTFSAVEDTNPGSGTMSMTTVGTNSGTVSAGSISGMSVTSNSGTVTAHGAGTISNATIGTISGTLIAVVDSTLGSGALSNISIGTLTASGQVMAASADQVTVSDLAGTIAFTGTLNILTVTNLEATAKLSAGQFNTVSAVQSAPLVKLVEPSARRTLQLTAVGSNLPAQSFGFYYNFTGSGNPAVTMQLNTGTNAGARFDLNLLTDTVGTPGLGIDLAGLYKVGSGGLRNILFAGNLVPGAANPGFFGLLPGTPGGVDLPQDTIAVAAAGDLPAASIIAGAVTAEAFGSAAGVQADSASHTDALVPLAAGIGLTQANDTYQVFVGEGHDVAQFLVTSPSGGSFDAKDLLYADQVADTHPVTASEVVTVPSNSSVVQEIDFTGNGASVNTSQPITAAINDPSGSLGDLILGAPGGITANVTAASIIGNIEATNGAISSTIETTQGDFGRAFTDANGNITGVTVVSTGGGGITGTGKLISAGNLISQINVQSGMDGVIFANGDIGTVQRDASGNAVVGTDKAKSLTRFGGIVVNNGGLNGQVVALGNIFGDINLQGGLSGQIAARGQQEFGLPAARVGILGNVAIGGGVGTTGAVVSAGLIGDDGTNNGTKELSQGTQLTISGTDKGILAAEEDINFGKTGSLNQAGIFENVGSSSAPKYDGGHNKAEIDAMFTQIGLSSILADLASLTVGPDGNLTSEALP
jgi:hypothetical protein